MGEGKAAKAGWGGGSGVRLEQSCSLLTFDISILSLFDKEFHYSTWEEEFISACW